MDTVVNACDISYRVEDCKLCIAGAGLAGLNALAVAAQYLKPDDKVILVDRKMSPGGMWTETYDYVRLHQPHKMFTVGNMAWEIDKSPDYLANRGEILDHFSSCIGRLRKKVALQEMYGLHYECHKEDVVGGKHYAHIHFHGNDSESKPLLIRAEKFIKAFGSDIPKSKPLAFSSSNIRSVSPESMDIGGDEFAESKEPVYIVGGGKTAMDTAHEILVNHPGKKVFLCVGKGTTFINRDRNFVKGVRRWFGGKLMAMTFLKYSMLFNGDNEKEVFDRFRSSECIQLHPECEQSMFGILSEKENELIASRCSEVMMDYVSDIVDRDGKTVMLMRSGDSRAIETGSWVVNCTGYMLRGESEYEPYVSKHGTTISVQHASGVFSLSSFGAYFLSHLFFLDKLKSVPLYELDQEAIMRQNKTAGTFALMTQMLYNTMLIEESVPVKVMLDCHLDYDRWYPMHRRVIVLLRLKYKKKAKLAHLKNTLDYIANRYEVRCGVLSS